MYVERVTFLTPASVVLSDNGKEIVDIVNVDIYGKKVYKDGDIYKYSDLVIEYLDKLMELPDNIFEASGEVYDKFREMNRDYQENFGEFVEFVGFDEVDDDGQEIEEGNALDDNTTRSENNN